MTPLVETQSFDPSVFDNPNQWAVYSHTLFGEPNPAWIGYCRLADVFLSPDARESAAWRAQVLPVAGGIRLRLHSLHRTGKDAMRECLTMVRRYKPPVNGAEPPRSPAGHRRLRCIDTGVEYESAAAACRAHGLHQSQMSSYLNNRNSKHIGGLRFEWC